MINSHPDPAFALPFEPTPRQLEILERALDLVQETGLANLTLKKVAERVGFTEAAIYRHFASKGALLQGLIALIGTRLLGPVREISADRSLPAAERLERMVLHHVGILRATRGLPLILIAEGLATQDDELLARLRTVMTGYLGLLAGLLTELDLPAGVPPASQALYFLGLPAALGLGMRTFPERMPGDEEVEQLVRYYVGALTAPGRRTPESAP
jgi:AcrR family transcriptional regulator